MTVAPNRADVAELASLATGTVDRASGAIEPAFD